MRRHWIWLLILIFAVAIMAGLLIGHNQNQQQFIDRYKAETEAQAQSANEEIAALQAQIDSLNAQTAALVACQRY